MVVREDSQEIVVLVVSGRGVVISVVNSVVVDVVGGNVVVPFSFFVAMLAVSSSRLAGANGACACGSAGLK